MIYKLEARLTADKKENTVHAVEFTLVGDNLITLKHVAVDIDAKHIVENLSLFGKIKLRVRVSDQYGARKEVLHFSAERPHRAGNIYFQSEV